MTKKPVPYLCGGIFLVLLTEAKGKSLSRRQLRQRQTDKISNRNMLESLIQMFSPSFRQPPAGRTFEGDTSDYRACKVSFGENLPFDDDPVIKAFDGRIKSEYITVLSGMEDFIDAYLKTDNEPKMEWLIKALLTIIDKDPLLPPETLFYLSETPITKTNLLALDHYCLSTLLLGIWHFIVANRPNNEDGRDTFLAIHDRADEMNAKWKFKKDYGMDYPREFDFDLFSRDEGVDEKTAEKDGEEIKKAPADEAEAEVIDEAVPLERKTIIKEGRIYQQQAEKIYNIEHIENFYG